MFSGIPSLSLSSDNRGKKIVAVVVVTGIIKGHAVFFDSKLYFHNYIDFIFSEYIKLLGLNHIFISVLFTWGHAVA
jgi:hypothetical protein